MKSKREVLDLYLPHPTFPSQKVLYFTEVLFRDDDRDKASLITIIHRDVKYEKIEETQGNHTGFHLEPRQIHSFVYQYSFIHPQLPPGTLEEVKTYQGDFREPQFRYRENCLEEYLAPKIARVIGEKAGTVVQTLRGVLSSRIPLLLRPEEKTLCRRVLAALQQIKV